MAFLDKNGLAHLWNHIVARLNTKVDAVDGKGLSTEDYTTEDKTTLSNLNALVGDTSVSTQIDNALEDAKSYTDIAVSDKADTEHTHDEYAKIADLDSVAFDGYVTKGAESGSTIGANATVEGVNNIASSKQAHAEGGYTRAGDLTIYSEFSGSYDSYGYEHAEGYSTLAKGNSAHAEGAYTQAISSMSHAEGLSTVASKTGAHAEGKNTTASGYNSHAEGSNTTSSGENTHAEGNGTIASLQAAHAEGYNTTASGYASHAEGLSTKASSAYQHVQGKYNIEDTASTYAHIVGNGTSDSKRSNAHTLDWNGNAWFKGSVYVGGTGQSSGTVLASTKSVTTMEYNTMSLNNELQESTLYMLTDDTEEEDLQTTVNEMNNIDYEANLAFDVNEIV